MESSIATQTTEEHPALLALISELDKALSRLPNDIDWGQSVWAQDQELLDLVRVQTTSLRCATDTAVRGHYRESYNTIRMVLEGYLLLRLVSTCDKYPTWYKVKRASGDGSLDEARAKAKQELRLRSTDIVDIEDVDNRTLVVIRRGIRVVDSDGNDTGVTVPLYYKAWHDYQPTQHHLQRTDVQRELLPQWAAAGGARTSLSQIDHRTLYSRLLSFDSIVKHLRLNGVLTRKTATRIIVHYNFLSGFTHSTAEAMRLCQSWHRFGVDTDVVYNHYKSELALLYICHLLGMHLRFLLHYFRRWRPSHVRNANKLYYPLCRRVDDDFGYFWFIFNHPHEFDRYQHANRRCDYTRGVLFRPTDTRLGDVRYYDDPLNRLRDMHGSQHELTTGNVYDSPFPREDAVLPIF